MNKEQTMLAYAAYEPNNDEILCIVCGVVVMKHSPTLKCGCSPALGYKDVVTANVAHVAKYKQDMKSAGTTIDYEAMKEHLKLKEGLDEDTSNETIQHAKEIGEKLHAQNMTEYVKKVNEAMSINKVAHYITQVYKDIGDRGFSKIGYKL